MTENRTRFVVRYYDAKLSKKGKGTQVCSFATREEAERFAAQNKLYNDPCKVEERVGP